MSGVQFLTGQKAAAVLDLKAHEKLWEDIQDALVSRSREREKALPLVKARLVASGKLT